MLVISRRFTAFTALLTIVAIGGAHAQDQGRNQDQNQNQNQNQDQTSIAGSDVWQHAAQQLAEGRNTFRFDTFGDETFWGDQLKLHEAIAQASPKMALGLGLKVDVAALPHRLIAQLRQGTVNLASLQLVNISGSRASKCVA